MDPDGVEDPPWPHRRITCTRREPLTGHPRPPPVQHAADTGQLPARGAAPVDNHQLKRRMPARARTGRVEVGVNVALPATRDASSEARNMGVWAAAHTVHRLREQ